MTFGQQPQGNNNQYGNVNGQPQYGQPQYAYAQGQSQYAYGPNGAAAMNAQAAYSYEQVQQAERASVTRAYGEMTIGLIITAVVAVVAQMTGAYIGFLQATGLMGILLFVIIQVGMAMYLGARIMTIKASTARVMFYVYAALMGFTLSSIFMVYDLGSIGLALGMTALFFFVLTMFGLTTKMDMLKAGPILMVALIVLIVSQLILAFLPVSGMTQIVCALGLIIFAGMTMYDAQQTRALFAAYEAQGPEMIRKISVVCALNLYLDFVNMFMYLLQLFGNRD
ncbi:Inhibitor of apoptosis-promoting Bax1 [Bifidobacterium ramosum]|uniref:BAX inhibitor (BI)-1/YccA family protein n=1 Tax=Bifidobacterium ramosum TaxID=1798158 RepID=A0A6L4X2G3_9BIFI|nr:Bax inhibitor-1/YccA family protein [Bifidobacterium ramosum]KAB8289175.1 Inhibitor of apoptosis-promoting Bax1 [Bifidobacterium ramosum]NEG70884.1 BAX inhibitor (BI)-1/YccA family protein [Bifidobacterium ramosum]